MTTHTYPLFFLILCCALIPTAHSICYTAYKSNYSCILCLSDDRSSVVDCSYSSGGGDSCRAVCCDSKLTYGVTVPSNCYSTSTGGSGSSISVSTIVVIVVFSIPVVICVILLIHACIVGINRSTAQPARGNRREERQAASAFSLQNYNIEDSFPYYIDP